MNYMELFFAAALGAAVGSFLGVVIDRMEGSEPTAWKVQNLLGRSRCSRCKHQLSWWENIPLLSYIFLHGRCRSCRSSIPYWLPLIELAGAAAGAAIAAQISQISPIWLISQILIAAALIWIFFSDLIKGAVPDWAVAIGASGAILSHLSFLSNLSYLGAAVGAALFFWLLVLVTRGRGMGTGDITLAFFLGLWLGWPKIAVSVWLAFLLGAVVALGLIASKRKKFGQTVPFGPFLIAGSIIAKIWGSNLIELFLTI